MIQNLHLKLLVLFCSAMTTSAFSQNQIFEGFIVTTTNDTVYGQIEYVNPAFNELNVIFYNEKGKKQKFSPSDLSEYAFKIEQKGDPSAEPYWMHFLRRRVQKSPIRQGTQDVFVHRQIVGEISLYNYYTLKTSRVNQRSYEHVYYVEKQGVGGFGMTLIDHDNFREAVRQYVVQNNEILEEHLGTLGYGYKYLSKVVAYQNAWLTGEKMFLGEEETPITFADFNE